MSTFAADAGIVEDLHHAQHSGQFGDFIVGEAPLLLVAVVSSVWRFLGERSVAQIRYWHQR
jgi:hypothetical protein